MCSLCQLPVAKNHNFRQFLTLLRAPVPTPFTDEDQIWCARADPRSTLTGQVSSECVHCVGFRWPKTTILGGFPVSPGSAEALVRWGGKIKKCLDCLLSRQHFCQKLLQSNRVCKDYSNLKLGRFLRHSVVSNTAQNSFESCSVCQFLPRDAAMLARSWAS